MTSHLSPPLQIFHNGCDRADGLRHLHSYLKSTAPAALNCDDILRSAVVLVVSSFDLFMHEVFRKEVLHRLGLKKEISSLRIPFNAALMSGGQQMTSIEEALKKENSYKSFVAPDKLAECLRPFLDTPWEKIATAFGDSSETCKTKLRAVVDLRNRIAHEADVNPAYGGIELWPIYAQDVESCISFLRCLGVAISQAMTAD